MNVLFRKIIGIGVMAALLAGTFAGCAGAGGQRQFPTPTPRSEGVKGTTDSKVTGMVTSSGDVAGTLKSAGSYEAVYSALKAVKEHEKELGRYWYKDYTDGMWVEEESVDFDAAPDMAPTDSKNDAALEGSGSDGIGGTEFSSTNVQVEGIDEADIIKTDGEYFYIFDSNRNAISIVSVYKGAMSLVSEVSVSDELHGNETGREMYLAGDRLVLLVSGFEEIRVLIEPTLDGVPENFSGYASGHAVTKVFTYDVSNRRKPVLVSSLEQDGRMVSSRCTDGKVYVISSHGYEQPWYYTDIIVDAEMETKTEDFSSYIPEAEGRQISPDCIYISEEPVSDCFLVVTSMSPENPVQYSDVKSLLADGDECYVSNNYIYVSGSRWQTSEIPYDRTEVYRFAYADGGITPAGQVTIKGRLDDQFSMDEYKGNLRVVTTVNESWKESNALYIYDNNLNLTGSIENLAPEEHIKSARLMGDVGYFVTFRQTDPLFSVDLSDPTNPKVLGALKIPGFSSYLHPYGDGLLLGIGYDANEQTGITTGLKLSMFDVSDPTDVKEVHKYSLTEFSYTGVENSHKAALIDTERDIIGFPARGYGNASEYNAYLIFGYDEKTGFYQKFSEGYSLDYGLELQNYKHMLFYSDCRGAYIGDCFYMINPSYEVKAYDINTWKEIGRVCLSKEIEERLKITERIQNENPEPVGIDLESNPGNSYNWAVTTEGDSVVFYNVKTLSSAEKIVPGVKILRRYLFKVNNIGTTKVTFEYTKAWGNDEPTEALVYEITVDDDLSVTTELVEEREKR